MDVKMKSIFFFIGFLFLLAQIINASLIIEREVPVQVQFNEDFQINLKIHNGFDEVKSVSITEILSGFEPLDNIDRIIFINETELDLLGNVIAVHPPFYFWEVDLTPNALTTITYRVKAVELGYIDFAPAVVNSVDDSYESETDTIRVLCNMNSICEPEEDEHYFNCPEDCPSGGTDGVCDLLNDGVADPDCVPGTDPPEIIDYCDNERLDPGEEGLDCGGDCPPCNDFCGDGYCEDLIGETIETCPQDCPTEEITLQDVLAAIQSWKNNEITLKQLLDIIHNWLNQ